MNEACAETSRRMSKPALLIVVAACLPVVLLISALLIHPGHVRTYSREDICRLNLHSLSVIMLLYADEHATYPAGDKWCDLIQTYEIRPETLRCPLSAAAQGQSTYALNANAAGRKPDDLPSDMVLLFESQPGWNQAGGPELLTTDNHEGQGCDVAFVDGRVEFVRTEDLGKLRWIPERATEEEK